MGSNRVKLRLVGRVLDIDGPRMMFTRPNAPSFRGRWFVAVPGMDVFLNDEFQTDGTTIAKIEFASGGRATIPPLGYNRKPAGKKTKKISIYPDRSNPIYPQRTMMPIGRVHDFPYVKVVGSRRLALVKPNWCLAFPRDFWAHFAKEREEDFYMGGGGIEG